MALESRARCVVVGYDGSPASRPAVARVAHRAGADGTVFIVHAYSLPTEWIAGPGYQQLLDGRARAPLGSVAHELIHLAECPVTLIPGRAVARADAQAGTGAVS
jgi:nucleotide-binding universal stress UspA family protein